MSARRLDCISHRSERIEFRGTVANARRDLFGNSLFPLPPSSFWLFLRRQNPVLLRLWTTAFDNLPGFEIELNCFAVPANAAGNFAFRPS